MEMYKVNGEQCKKCGKLFRPDAKVVKMVDTDGNELHIDLCQDCELDSITEEIADAKHISREEAEKDIRRDIWDMTNDAIRELVFKVEPYNGDVAEYNNYWIEQTRINVPKAVQFQNMASIMLKDEMLNAVVRMVKDNE
jgi:hypothetical protein